MQREDRDKISPVMLGRTPHPISAVPKCARNIDPPNREAQRD